MCLDRVHLVLMPWSTAHSQAAMRRMRILDPQYSTCRHADCRQHLLSGLPSDGICRFMRDVGCAHHADTAISKLDGGCRRSDSVLQFERINMVWLEQE